MPALRTDNAYWTPFTTHHGTAYAASTDRGLCRLSVPSESREHFLVWLRDHFTPERIQPDPRPNVDVVQQVDEYLRGERSRFELNLDLIGTEFQRAVWDAVLKIPYGQTTTYAALADELGMPRAYQAVGAAIGQNPVLVVVPCHRVVGTDGNLTGYAGGIGTKRWLLQHEGVILL